MSQATACTYTLTTLVLFRGNKGMKQAETRDLKVTIADLVSTFFAF